ncbi:hypothetical protein PSHT_09362 [Puccinia striiformis]|uniref:Uncharacterized protein n=1 Tax=Puccinia striiformis TaxID=27350 RepID=A0A2S4VHL4_9BASI|nr:hypothetical protein PSHT_09362 [Puccinia striiformis]
MTGHNTSSRVNANKKKSSVHHPKLRSQTLLLSYFLGTISDGFYGTGLDPNQYLSP